MNPAKPTHLGDGAYVTITTYNLCLTANHHDPSLATDTVWLEESVLNALITYIRNTNPQLLQ